MPQSESTPLSTPAEIQHEIFSYLLPSQIHICLRGDKFCVLACLLPDGDEDTKIGLDGYDRQPSDDDGFPSTNATWARCLRSSWGPHWMCDEIALDGQSEKEFDMSIFLSKRIASTSSYAEVFDLMVRTAVVHITDLDTLECLDGKLEMPTTTSASLFPPPLLNIVQLSITLRLPLAFFEALERRLPEDTVIALGSELEPALAGMSRSWLLRLPSTLSRLKNLTQLRLWLDYSYLCSWSLVNERALLSPIPTFVSPSNLSISVILPKLHPKYEREARHFSTGTLEFRNAQLHHQFRQRWHVHANFGGSVEMVYKSDFPFLIGVIAMDIEELEELEWRLWKERNDVERDVEETIGWGFCAT
ncbi:hypothetical protein EJ02DRAFT_466276 [Clathrospora elynae]|uniref:Uncharacterized protein n=1 Tax=Clathrospora elynae TaxID=706981 RepID=A0A6A5SQ72_9PLEO|nr:hypothetical protein EJ02DRAFT_466276 [Clathrospora elynae]